MKIVTKFTEKNIYTVSSAFKNEGRDYKKIACDKEDLTVRETPWQKRGFQQTASGYRNKLTTRYLINFEGRDYRVYCRCFSNSGICYIITKKFGEVVIDAL